MNVKSSLNCEGRRGFVEFSLKAQPQSAMLLLLGWIDLNYLKYNN